MDWLAVISGWICIICLPFIIRGYMLHHQVATKWGTFQGTSARDALIGYSLITALAGWYSISKTLSYFGETNKPTSTTGFERKKTLSRNIEKNYTFTDVTFHNWGSGRVSNSRPVAQIGVWTLFTSIYPLDLVTVDQLKKLFDEVEIDKTEQKTIYTLKKYKVCFETDEFEELLVKFDAVMSAEEKIQSGNLETNSKKT